MSGRFVFSQAALADSGDHGVRAIANAHLRAGCIDTIDLEQQSSARWHQRMTGSTNDETNSTGPSLYAPKMNDAGSGR
jgi:hypothetical protein